MSSSIHQHPLGYLLGLQGVALMKAFAGEYDAAFTAARIAEVRALLDDTDRLGGGHDLEPLTVEDAYDGWAASYDEPGNGIFEIEEPVLLPLLDRRPPGVAIDAACGTGRLASYLSERGHRVLGFDASPRMLEQARLKVPVAQFGPADVRALPVDDGSADLVVCALALSHVENLSPVFAEVARVLRPGGHFVLSDTRGQFVGSGRYPLVKETLDGRIGYLPNWRHPTSAYLQAALPHGFAVVECQEPLRVRPVVDPDDPDVPDVTEPADPALPPDIWMLHDWVPEAAVAAFETEPALVVWDFELEGG